VRLVFEDQGWEDYTSWLANDRKMLRIDDEHRLVYLVTDKDVVILAARYRY
jgi:toxin YoeB